MSTPSTCSGDCIAMVIRGRPYARRSARSELDITLLAAAIERPLRVYFLGPAVMQLLKWRELGPAQLPAGYRAWASVSELTQMEAFAEPNWLDRLKSRALPLQFDPRPMERAEMSIHWRDCARVMVL